MAKGKLWISPMLIVIIILTAPVLQGSVWAGSAQPGTDLADNELADNELSDTIPKPVIATKDQGVALEVRDFPGELDGFEDDLKGNDPFDTIDTSIPESAKVVSDNGAFRMGGFIRIESEYAYDKADEKLSTLMPLLYIEAAYKINGDYKAKVSGQGFYDLAHDIENKKTHKGFNQDDEFKDIELKDFYLDGKLSDSLSIRIGRQIIAWGDSDYAKITDVINPRDLTSPGLIDLEDARLQVAALRFTAVFDTWTIEAVSIHEHPGSMISGKGSDFDYYKLLRSPVISVTDKDTPDVALDNTGVAVKVIYGFNGGDISFMAANTFDDRPYLRYDGFNGSVMTFTPLYDRISTIGMSSSLVKGSALFKLETAFRHDRRIMRNDVLTQIVSGIPKTKVNTTSREDQIAGLIGVEYTGFSDLRLSFETQVIHTLNRPGYLSVDETQVITYFQATKDLFNEILELDLFWVYMNPGHGNILRLSGTYDLFDGFRIQAGMAFYASEKSSSDLHVYKDQDRIFIRLKYSF